MSHEIKRFDVQEGRTMAWHGLTRVNPELTLANCWLGTWDYEAKPVIVDGVKTPFRVLGVTDNCPMSLIDENGTESIETYPLAIGMPYAADSFKPVHNQKLLEMISKEIDGKGLTLESNGTVMNRGRQFISLALPDSQFEAAKRKFISFLNIGNGNDKSSPLWVNTSNTCTVCNNTFTMNMSEAGLIMSVKKTKFSEFKLTDMGRAIAAMLRGQKQFAITLGELASVECDETTAREFFAGFIGDAEKPLTTTAANRIERLLVLFKTGAGNDGNDYSDVFQALTDFFTHEAASAQEGSDARWKNFVSSEFGAGKNAKMESWHILTDTKLRKATVLMGKKVLKLTAQAARDAAKAETTPVAS